MGQYHLTVNLDKREFISPHKLASGLKLWEQLAAEIGPGKALVVLLAHPAKRGGGDFEIGKSEYDPLEPEYAAIAQRTIGRWRGDRIAIIGDYAEDGDLPNRNPQDPPESVLYTLCGEPGGFKDVTDDVCTVIEHELGGKFTGEGWGNWTPQA